MPDLTAGCLCFAQVEITLEEPQQGTTVLKLVQTGVPKVQTPSHLRGVGIVALMPLLVSWVQMDVKVYLIQIPSKSSGPVRSGTSA